MKRRNPTAMSSTIFTGLTVMTSVHVDGQTDRQTDTQTTLCQDMHM